MNPDLVALLKTASMRVTKPRVAVLEAVHRQPHSDTDAIVSAVRTELGTVSTQAVYDVLRALTSAGLVRRFQPAGSPARYEIEQGDNHHHLVCRSCGRIVDVDCADGRRPCLQTPEDHGYRVDQAEVTYWGTCPDCRARGIPDDERGRPDLNAGPTT